MQAESLLVFMLYKRTSTIVLQSYFMHLVPTSLLEMAISSNSLSAASSRVSQIGSPLSTLSLSTNSEGGSWRYRAREINITYEECGRGGMELEVVADGIATPLLLTAVRGLYFMHTGKGMPSVS